MKQYDYLVAYKFDREGYLTPSNGVICISMKKKIKTFDDIKEIRDYISKQLDGASNIGIYNFCFIGKNKHE